MRMRMIDGALRLSASDLMRVKGCRHATTLDLRMMEVGDLVPTDDRAEAELLQRQGDAHELAFLDELKRDAMPDRRGDGARQRALRAARTWG